MSEVSHQLGPEPHVHSGDRSQATGHFISGMGESGSEAVCVDCRVQRQATLSAEFMKMVHSQFQNIGFFQFGDVFTFRLESADHEFLELIETAVDASAPFALEHRLHHFAILISARDGLRAVVRDRVREIVRHGRHWCVSCECVR